MLKRSRRSPMRDGMRRIVLALAIALIAAAPAHAATLGNWDKSEQRTVARAGVLPKLDDGFHGERSLTPGQLEQALANIGAGPAVSVTASSITVATFHKYVVKQLGLADVARAVQAEASKAGLKPPSRFGAEVVARVLGLRYDHPSQDDSLELYPTDVITRAEAAYSFARILQNGTGSAYYAREVLSRFTLPTYTDAQKRILTTAVSKIGMPYVWGGETDAVSSQYGPQAHGGYDCSGFVWRVFKLSGDPAGASIGGRTAAAMALEIKKSARLKFARVQPADLLFFGNGITHVGIAMSKDFMIHSSGQGVAITPLFDDYRQSSFDWARRVL
jgi:cell wall-associated NlpC family hydrolase